MDPNPSTLIVIAITAVGAIAWLAGLAVMARATREPPGQGRGGRRAIRHRGAGGGRDDRRRGRGRGPSRGALGEAGRAAGPRRHGAVRPGQDRRLRPPRAGLRVRGPEPRLAGGVGRRLRRPVPVHRDRLADPHRVRHRGAVRARPDRVRLALRRPGPRGAGRRAAGSMFAYVLPSPNPGVRGQAVQMVQVVPLPLAAVPVRRAARQPARMIQARVSAMVHNLPYS